MKIELLLSKYESSRNLIRKNSCKKAVLMAAMRARRFARKRTIYFLGSII